jgi:phosphoribosylcarboxyaminoimidazole (NCAIR) mutase
LAVRILALADVDLRERLTKAQSQAAEAVAAADADVLQRFSVSGDGS